MVLARGAVIGSYPYGFANVAELGYAPVLGTLALVLLFGLAVAAAYWGVDVLRSRQRVGVRR